MALYMFFVVNKSGGLIFSRELTPSGAKLGGNENLLLASTFHSLHAISKQLAPVKSGGIAQVDSPAFSLHCLETPTGLKFFVTAKPRTEHVGAFLRKAYEFYSDFALKNPFYEVDMPIRIRLFDHAIDSCARAMGLSTPAPPASASSGGGGASWTGSSTS